MIMLEWAKKEIEIACKKETPNKKEDEWNYGCACYESALKALSSLLEDGHSGFSMGITMHILNRLLEWKPLTPIEDTDDIWNPYYYSYNSGDKQYQCTRMSSLFKTIHSDGSIEYRDVDRVVCTDINNENNTYHSGLVTRIVHEMYPIKMPYMPSDKPFNVYVSDYLTDPNNGDFDTIGIHYLVTPDGNKVDINRYFKEDADDGETVEITSEEMFERIKMHHHRLKSLLMEE